jgi:hypothetical protein
MPIQIKDVGTLATKFVNRAVGAVADYKAGVMAPKTSQSAAAIAAAPNWQQAVSSQAAMNRFTAGLRAAGDQGWQTGASTKGAAHYPDGIRGAQQKWATNVGPFLAALASLSLPPKGIRGSDANIGRVSAVASALHALKLQRAGGG